MPVQAQGPDGTLHEFPDGTPDAVIDRVMKGVITGAAAPADDGLPTGDEPAKRGFIDNLGKGIERVAGTVGNAFGGNYKDPVRLKEVEDIGENFARSAAAPVGGDYVAAGGENIAHVVRGEPINHDAVADQRARRQQLAQDNPTTALAGEGMGLVSGGGVASNLVEKAAAKVMPTATRLAKIATAGAVTSGGASAAEGNDAGKVLADTATGAIAAPVIDKAIRVVAPAIGGVIKYARSFVPGDEAAASAVAADKISSKLGPVDMPAARQYVADFKRENGRVPNLAEITEAKSQGRLAKLAAGNKIVGDQAIEAADKSYAALPDRTQTQIRPGTGEADAQTAQVALTQRANKTMEVLGNQRILVDPQRVAALRSRPVLDTLNTSLRNAVPNSPEEAALTSAIDKINQVRPTFVTVRQIDDIRRTVNDLIDRKLVGRDMYTKIVEPIEMAARSKSKAYDTFLTGYAKDANRVEGLTAGSKVLSAKTTPYTAEVNRGANQAEVGHDYSVGTDTGARTAMIDTAGEGPRTAASLQKDLAESPGLKQRVSAAMDPAEADRLQRTAAREVRATSNLEAIRPAPRDVKEASDYAKEAARGLIAVTGGGGGFAKVNAIGGIGSWFHELGLPPAAAKKTAAMLFDPGQIDNVLDRLTKIGVSKEKLADLTQRIAVATQAYDKDRK